MKQQKTHCPKGHPYDEANTMLRKNTARGKVYILRTCRACYLAYQKHYTVYRRKNYNGEGDVVR